MAYTSHGHHIPGTVKEAGEPQNRVRCGGPRLCDVCQNDVAKNAEAHQEAAKKAEGVKDFPVPYVFSQETPDFHLKARLLVQSYFNRRVDKSDGMLLSLDCVYIVWFTKVLQNWKALASTSVPDGMYYEITYDGEKKQAYIDAYKKFDNVCVPDDSAIW